MRLYLFVRAAAKAIGTCDRQSTLRAQTPSLFVTRTAVYATAAVVSAGKWSTSVMDCPGLMENSAGARLFVYGTLRKGFRAHGLLQRFHARLLGAGHIRGWLYDLGEYPGAAEGTGAQGFVEGELYSLPG